MRMCVVSVCVCVCVLVCAYVYVCGYVCARARVCVVLRCDFTSFLITPNFVL